MVTIEYNGRLGNNLIQFLAGYYLSRKKKLKFNGFNNRLSPIIKNNISFEGNIFSDSFNITDDNYIEVLENEKLIEKNFHLTGFFQKKEFLEKNEEELKKFLNIEYSEVDKNDLFLHYRIGDIENDRRMLPIEYYEDAISRMSFNQGYISSDSINHKFCKILIDKYNLIPIHKNDLDLLLYAKNFNNIILSEGTFSWWIGFLSKTNNIIYNRREYFWHGDIFLNRWYNLSWDYDIKTIFNNYKLTDYKPIKKTLC